MDTNQQLLERRAQLLAELSRPDVLIVGSFFEREVHGIRRYCLSRMMDGKQRQVYVSAEHRSAVQKGVQRYQKVLELLRELGETNLKLVKRGVTPDGI